MGKNNPETRRLWNEANREKILEQQRARRRLHPERTKHQNDKYKAEHPEEKKAADKKWQEENRDRVRENAKAWRARNREKHNARTRQWRLENPEKMKSARDAWLERNKAKKKKSEADWRATNEDRISIKGRKRYRAKGPEILAKTRAWQKANPEKCKQIGARRRASMWGATIEDTKEIAEWEKSWRSKPEVQCTYCKQMFPPKECDSDHIIPLSRKELNPTHSVRNLTIACAWCNRSKGDRTVEEWNAVKLERPTSSPEPSSSSQDAPAT